MILQIKKYATLIKWGGIVLVTAGILYSVYDYSQSKERLSNVESNNSLLIDQMSGLQDNINIQKLELNQIRNNYQQIELLYSKQIEAINELRQLTSIYIRDNQPEVELELNNKFKSIDRQIQCLTGDRSKCQN